MRQQLRLKQCAICKTLKIRYPLTKTNTHPMANMDATDFSPSVERLGVKNKCGRRESNPD